MGAGDSMGKEWHIVQNLLTPETRTQRETEIKQANQETLQKLK